MVPRIEKTQIIFLLLVWWLSVTSFRVWVCECAWNLVETYCLCNFALRPDGVNFYQVVFFKYYMFIFTGSFVSAMITCDKFLCCYYETCRCRKLAQFRTQLGFIAKTAWIELQTTKFRFRVVKKMASKHWEPLKRNVLISSKEVLWISFKRRKLYSGILVHDCFGPESQKIYDSLDWFEGADNVLRLQTEVRDEVGERGKSRM